MLGTLRLLLALFVAVSHAGVRWGQLNPGVIAVVGFYAISGYVMTALIRRHYASSGRVPAFYADRALRLLPAYFVAALAALAWFAWHGPEPHFLVRSPTVADLLNNLLVVPLNYYMWNGSDKFSLVPPAWSLGAEIQFYLLFPLLILVGLRKVAFVASLLVFLCAFAGLIHTEWFGYRLLPGVLFVFLLGSVLHDCHQNGRAGRRRAQAIVAATVLGVVALAVAGHGGGTLHLPYNLETLVGLCAAIPLLHLLAPRPPSSWDERAGELSYGLFLLHFLVFWIWPGADGGALALALRVAVALALALALHRFVEAPVLAWRRRLRPGAIQSSRTLP